MHTGLVLPSSGSRHHKNTISLISKLRAVVQTTGSIEVAVNEPFPSLADSSTRVSHGTQKRPWAIALLIVISVKDALSLGSAIVITTLFLTRGPSNYYYAVIGHFTCQTATSLGRAGCRIVTRPLFLLVRVGVWARDYFSQ